MRFSMTRTAPQIGTSSELVVAPATMLYITETAWSIGALNEIKLFHIGILSQRLSGAIENDSAAFKNIAISGIAKTDVGILFY